VRLVGFIIRKGVLIVWKAEDSVLVMKMLMLRIVQNDLNLFTNERNTERCLLL
jgi:hypothetical protein